MTFHLVHLIPPCFHDKMLLCISKNIESGLYSFGALDVTEKCLQDTVVCAYLFKVQPAQGQPCATGWRA